MLCERCGNDYNRKPVINKEGNKVTYCPFCSYTNLYLSNKKKKRGTK